jgi:glutamate racemase
MRPIGLFDSGLGGLSVARVLMRRMPHESLWVVGDTANVPYGGRPLEQVHRFAMGLTGYLARSGCRAVVMACNISSAVALDDARRSFTVPVFGLVDAGARAAAALPANRIGVLATEGTVRSGAYTHALRTLRPDAAVVEVPCPRFVPLVEAARWDSEEADNAARVYAAPLVEAGVDAVILGCTHYPFLARAIHAAFPYPVQLVDPAESVCDDLLNTLGQATGETPRHRFEATGDPSDFARSGSRLLDREFSADACPVWESGRSTGARPLLAGVAAAS